MTATIEGPPLGETQAVPSVDAAWCDEIARRIADVRAGRVQLETREEGNALIRERLAQMRRP